jgi:23S rRNA (adenine2503-C2)-methyltransferase
MTNLIGRTRSELLKLVAPLIERSFRSDQVAQWILIRHASSFGEMTNLPKAMRAALDARFELREPELVEVVESADGARKHLFRLADGATIEGVAMPEERKVTLCLSSQAGCALGCRFCVTGALGPGRNLTSDEMVGQFRVMMRGLAFEPERVNIVFMGMGEPLLNTANLGRTLEVLTERVSPRRITVSTAGVVPGIRWLASLDRRPKLAVSLNAPDQERRRELMPISGRYPLGDLLRELRVFPLEQGRRITFEYVLISGFNDAPEDADAVADLLRGIPAKVNAIPLNPDPVHLPGLERPTPDAVDRFATRLRDAGVTVTVRWSRGTDVAAACGQLKGARSGPVGRPTR